jgi:hypothetical protein
MKPSGKAAMFAGLGPMKTFSSTPPSDHHRGTIEAPFVETESPAQQYFPITA